MTDIAFTRATKQQRRARIFLSGPSGSGKTWTALTWGRVLGEKIAAVDTEHGSMLAYADDFPFDHLALDPPYTVERYIAALTAAADYGYDVLIIDSLSHAWAGKGGLLEMVDNYGRAHRGDSFGAWRDVTPRHVEFVEALLSFPGHLIATARAKVDYQMQQNDRGKWEPVKMGLAPIQRDGLDYEFDVVAEMAVPENVLRITKTRCSALTGVEQVKPDETVAKALAAWLGEGKPVESESRPTVADVFAQAKASTDVADLRALYKTAEQWHLLPSPVTWPDSDEETTLGEFIAARGREAQAYADQGTAA